MRENGIGQYLQATAAISEETVTINTKKIFFVKICFSKFVYTLVGKTKYFADFLLFM